VNKENPYEFDNIDSVHDHDENIAESKLDSTQKNPIVASKNL
jgi:hypothetical protein